ncbi:TetR/AcrR family transcriptional regulator [Piscinibacter sakaiensis]|uniref:TetR/AcrR family transcriptional regulator n=1 Tax=Piscinibacter sakaiensis TaxID=1547922 RepID=UPI003AACC728
MGETKNPNQRSLILCMAALLFRQNGYERTTVREIAKALNLTSGSLFYHYASKEDLLVAVMEAGIRDVHDAVEQGVAVETRLPERMLAMTRCHLTALLGSNFHALSVMFHEWRSLSPSSLERVTQMRDAYEALWASPIDEAAALGLVDTDTLLVRYTVLGALNWTGQWYKPDRRLGVDALAQRLFGLLLPRVAAELGSEADPRTGRTEARVATDSGVRVPRV